MLCEAAGEQLEAALLKVELRGVKLPAQGNALLVKTDPGASISGTFGASSTFDSAAGGFAFGGVGAAPAPSLFAASGSAPAGAPAAGGYVFGGGGAAGSPGWTISQAVSQSGCSAVTALPLHLEPVVAPVTVLMGVVEVAQAAHLAREVATAAHLEALA